MLAFDRVKFYVTRHAIRSSLNFISRLLSDRELVDAECYRLAYDFVCQVLQPACVPGQPEDLLQLPCRSFCREFWNGCGSRLPDRIKRLLDCSNFPEYADQGGCRAKPGERSSCNLPRVANPCNVQRATYRARVLVGCVQALQAKALSPRICDGVIDCPDLSDEKNCAYCRDGYMHCGIGRTCIPRGKRCDGKVDCTNGSDEKDCREYLSMRSQHPSVDLLAFHLPYSLVSLAPSLRALKSQPADTPHAARYSSEGFVVFNEKGTIGKLCTANLNATLPATEMETVLQTAASSLCSLLTYT